MTADARHHGAVRDPSERTASAAARRRLSLRAKGAFALMALVIYVVATGAVISISRDGQRAVVEDLQRTQRNEEQLAQANMAMAHAILTVHDHYIAAEPADVVQPIALDVEELQASLAALRADFPKLSRLVAVLRLNLDGLRLSPSRGDIALMRNTLHELVTALDDTTREVKQRKEALLAEYRVAQDRLSLQFVAFSIFGLVVVAAVMVLFFKRLALDMRNVAARAIDIVQGYRGAALSVSRGDEVGELMEALNAMQTELHKHEIQIELSRQQRFHREKMAAVGSLAAQLAHEINNPLTAIVGVAQTICDSQCNRDSDQAVADQARMILQQSGRVALITRQIAEFSAPHSTEPQLIDVNALVRSTCSFVSYDRRFRQIDLRMDLDQQLPALHAVGDHLTQVLMNLLINAADAMEGVKDRKPTITVATMAVEASVILSIADNGQGMSVETRRRAFDEFYTTKRAGKGSGLGLAICRNFVEPRGGIIRIHSELGFGTTVTVEFPLPADARAAA